MLFQHKQNNSSKLSNYGKFADNNRTLEYEV